METENLTDLEEFWYEWLNLNLYTAAGMQNYMAIPT